MQNGENGGGDLNSPKKWTVPRWISHAELIRLGDNSNSRRRNEFCEGESEKKEGNKTKRRNSQEKALRTFEENSQGRDP